MMLTLPWFTCSSSARSRNASSAFRKLYMSCWKVGSVFACGEPVFGLRDRPTGEEGVERLELHF